MNRGLVNLEELRNNFSKADFKFGKNSYCFIMGNKIIKLYAKKYDLDMPKNVCDLSKFKADTIVFPKKYIYENGVIVGEISEYINSNDITYSFDENANLEKIIEGFELVVQDIYTYSNLDMIDLCSVNILYSNESGFHIIDTTEWKISDDAHKLNMRRLNSSTIGAFVEYLEISIKYSKYYNEIDDNFYNNMAKYGKEGKRLQDNMKLLMNDKYRFIELLYAFMGTYREYASQDAKTLKDVKELTKVLKKG